MHMTTIEATTLCLSGGPSLTTPRPVESIRLSTWKFPVQEKIQVRRIHRPPNTPAQPLMTLSFHLQFYPTLHLPIFVYSDATL